VFWGLATGVSICSENGGRVECVLAILCEYNKSQIFALQPTNMADVPELGTTSGPLKSAAFFIGAHCKDYNGLPYYLCHTRHRLTDN
jgi:hypothetical protein